MIPKFRAYFNRYGRMIYGIGVVNENSILVDFNGEGNLETIFLTNDINLMQSTGLVDENGEEIFEGDILTDEGSFENDSWDYATIEFDETDYTYYLSWKNEGIRQSIMECENYSIAGNIYENKDLLNDGKEWIEELKMSLNKLARKPGMIKEEKKTMNFEELRENVEKWANDKDLLHEENADKQFMKFIEEVFEFKSEMDFVDWKLNYKEPTQDLKLELGDVMVTLIVLSKQLNVDIVDCLNMAYEKISKRKGKTVNGLFIKEEDL